MWQHVTHCLPFGKSSENWSSKAVTSKHDEKSDSHWKEGHEYQNVFVTWQSNQENTEINTGCMLYFKSQKYFRE